MPKPQKIDLSAGLEPSQPPIDLSAGLETPASGSSVAPTENSFQQYADKLTRIEPFNARLGVLGHIETGIGNVGAGFLSPLAMVAHPLDTAASIGRMGADAFSHNIDVSPDSPAFQMAKQVMTNPAGAAESALGQAGLGAGMGMAGEVAIPRVSSALKSLAPKVANASLGSVPDAYGGDPGMAIAQEGISGFSPQRILSRTKDIIPRVAAEHAKVLEGAEASPFDRAIRGHQPTIDIGDAISGPFDAVRNAKTNPLTGVAMPTQISKLNKMQTYLTHEPDPFTGQPTTGLRPLNRMNPLDANRLKSNIYEMTDYDNPFRSSLANDALKQSAHLVKNKIIDAVPEAAASGERLHHLMSLKDLMESKGPTGIPTSKSGVLDNVMRKTGTSAAGKMYRVGEQLPSLNRLLPGIVTAGGVLKKPGT